MEVKSDSLSSKAKLDVELIQQAVSGDQKAYAELLERYRDAIYFMLLKMVNNAADAEDLTIEAFGKAFKNIRQYTANFAFSTWLFKIASNNAIDFMRKKKLNNVSIDETLRDTDAIPVNIRSEQPTPEESLISEQKILMLRSIVAKLKPRYRKLVELRYFYEYSYEEISEEMGLPIGTVKAQLFRARELLQNVLKESNIQP
jgi:RNA polymerase sigma-70 factor (ECF subfamily)